MRPIHSILIANRSEIAIRVMRAASEMNMRTVAIYSAEDKLALHRFKADESYLVGEGKRPLQAYLDMRTFCASPGKHGWTPFIPVTAFWLKIPILRKP